MYLREAQAKQIVAQYGVPIPEGRVARSAEEAERRAREVSAERYVVKALISAGGRGLAGGVTFAATPSAVADASKAMIGSRLVTEQTGPAGEQVDEVYVEAALSFETALYLALVIDQRTALPTILGSTQGGVEFEAKATADPSIVHTLPLGSDGTIDPAKRSAFLSALGVGEAVSTVIDAMVSAYQKTDAALIEINPLAVIGDAATAIDAKIILDGNALYRHPELAALADTSQTNADELVARENEINFVKMDGNIGLVVNGAGLGLATHDMVVEAGGHPANFMDIRTTATSFQIAKGVGLLLDDPSVDVILVNIHGGGMTVCDTVAEGIGFAYGRSTRKPPIIYRAAGQNAPWSFQIMKNHRLPYQTAETMTEAVSMAVAKAGGRG